MRVIIENEVAEQLQDLKSYLIALQGPNQGMKAFKRIIASLDSLGLYKIGRNIKEAYQIECPDNWYMFTCRQNIFIYSQTSSEITVLKMYNERQDYIQDLFGVSMRSQESIDYWGE